MAIYGDGKHNSGPEWSEGMEPTRPKSNVQILADQMDQVLKNNQSLIELVGKLQEKSDNQQIQIDGIEAYIQQVVRYNKLGT